MTPFFWIMLILAYIHPLKNANMVAILGYGALALSRAKKWAAELRRGRKSLENHPRTERDATATTMENIVLTTW